MVTKGETYESSKLAMLKLKEAGIKTSVMVLTGLGGRLYSQQHAVKSAELLNEIQPEFASTLVLSFHYGVDKYKEAFKGEFVEMNTTELLEELQLFMQHLELKETVFRSDHASNYLVLKGELGKDKQLFLNQINEALTTKANLRPEWMRGL